MSSRITITPVFHLEQKVYAKIADRVGIVTGYLVRPGGRLIYCISWGGDQFGTDSNHFECELSDEKVYVAGVDTADKSDE